jgi:calcium permeable stress-gated cation channel
MQINAFWVSLGTSLGFSVLLALLFSLFRPYHNAIYAPRIKHADQKHAPPPVGKGFFAWIPPVLKIHEESLADQIGLDAVVFLRCAKMLRNTCLVLSIIGCGTLIAVNITQSTGAVAQGYTAFTLMTPLYISTDAVWAQVVCAYAFDFVIMFFLWQNYRAVLALRRRYFQSPEYQLSLHARTLMITDVPSNLRSEEGLMRLTDGVNPTSSLPRTTIGRNVKDLPSLIKKHDEAVRDLESVLARYLKNPDRLPPNRPTIRPSRKHKGEGVSGKVDAIDYLTDRIQELETRIKDVRQSVDKRNPMPYGFASWEAIEHAHAVAYTARKKKPQGTLVRLAPRPHDIIWENLHLSPQMRTWRRMVNVFWVALLTFLWIAPNAMIAIFLTDLSNLGLVWPAFQTSLEQHPDIWAAVQGIASPAVTSLIYIFLPIFFRRLMRRAGDITKTSRERHVIHYLYSFFVFNNLIVFSLFSAAWTFVAAVINARKNNESAWQAIEDGQFWYKSMSALCQVSPFWVTWLLQRNLGATLDLVQLFTVVWQWFMKTFMAPTPRQSIEWTAPPPFDYASYYNNYLFYATVAFCFATLQPIILPVAALSFALDLWLRRYLLLYVFITKNESGGRFWPIVINRIVFAAMLSNFVIALVAKAKGTWTMVFCLIPLPFILLGFRWYCARTFDDDMIYYNRATLNDAEALGPGMGKGPKRAGDRLNSRFGHPALYKPLVTPMVHARAAELLKSIYRGRLGQLDATGDYSDIAMQSMSTSTPGKPMEAAPFEVVAEDQLDFSYFKNRADFRDEFGGGIYGRNDDLISERSHTPRAFKGDSPDSSRTSSPVSMLRRKQNEGYDLGLGLPRPNDGDHPAFRPPLSRVASGGTLDPSSLYQHDNESESHLLSHAQPPAAAAPTPEADNFTIDRWRTRGYGPVAQDDINAASSYDYFRGKR